MSVNKTAHPFERSSLESLLIKRFFYCNAFEIYGGESNLTRSSESKTLGRRRRLTPSDSDQQVSRVCLTM